MNSIPRIVDSAKKILYADIFRDRRTRYEAKRPKRLVFLYLKFHFSLRYIYMYIRLSVYLTTNQERSIYEGDRL